MMKKTKIICTLGPATDKDDILRDMIHAGMNVARMNFSHGSHEEHLVRIKQVKAMREKLGIPVGIMLDTKGPEVRIKTFADDKINLVTGQKFTLTTRDVEGTNEIVSITYAGLPSDVKSGTRILIDDGLIEMIVQDVTDTDIICTVKNSGKLSNRKSINIPEIRLNMEYISPKDAEDIVFGIKNGIDFIAASFCRSAKDMQELKALLEKNDGLDIQIIAKIENMDGVTNIDEILEEVDGVMVARGDMGVEVDFEELPRIQKMLIKKCISRGKRVITATQMLDSMANNPRPTRAEVTDVANAVYDGTSAIMLSGETSIGKYPVETVATMAKIAITTENTIHYERRRSTREEYSDIKVACDLVASAIANSTCITAASLNSSCIVAFTESGHTGRAVSSFRPSVPVIAATPYERTYYGLSMSWGINPILVELPADEMKLYSVSAKAAVKAGFAKADDVIVITAGTPVGTMKVTNSMRVYKVTEADLH